MEDLLQNFRLNGEQEDPERVVASVYEDVAFRGTNLWILVFAIFIASLGLNVNSTAVVIGAMLISPLMGPIIGLGLGMAINDLALLKKAMVNYCLAVAVGLVTSTLFFSLSPLDQASSEILARTSPTIYDVLIALFGGFAGILAVSSKRKGNVIPGVAIATALMPPLCTAGFGLANGNFYFLFGALYLFVINTVFIALATLITARFLKFPYKQLPEKRQEVFAQRVVWIIVIVTVLPSIYFGYDIVKQTRFRQRADRFVAIEAVFPNDYLLKKDINAKNQEITLIFGGETIGDEAIEALRAKLPNYDLSGVKLEIQQGFAYLNDNKDEDTTKHLNDVLAEKDSEIRNYKAQLAAESSSEKLGQQICDEMKVQYPQFDSCIVQQVVMHDQNGKGNVWIALVKSNQKVDIKDQRTIEDWLKVRIGADTVSCYFERSATNANVGN